MDLSVKTKDLQDALSMAAATTDRGKSLVPIVTQVFLTADAKKETLTIRSTDAERAVTSVVPCSVKVASDINLNFSQVHSTVNLLSADTVRLKLNKANRLEITSGKSTSRIPINTFIAWPRMESANGAVAEVPANSLANALRQMMPMINLKDDGVVEVSTRPGVLRLVALNMAANHRIGATQFACVAPGDFTFLMHFDSAKSVRKLVSGANGMAKIQLGSHGTSVSTEFHSLYFLRRDKKMPAVDVVFNKTRDKSFQVETKDFTAALRRTMNFFRGESDKNSVADVLFGAKEKSLSLSFSAQDCESNESVDTDLGGNEPDFKLNGEYILSFMNEIWSKATEFRYGGTKDTIWVKPADAEYPLMVVLPIWK